MKCVIIGNCQSIVVGDQVRRLSPGVEVSIPFNKGLLNDRMRLEAFADIEGFDCVITQVLEHKRWGPLRTSVIVRKAKRIVYFPTIHFTGLHPDAVRISRELRLPTMLGVWQPGIAMAGFLLGLSPERIVDLYNAYIFDALGYFAEYPEVGRVPPVGGGPDRLRPGLRHVEQPGAVRLGAEPPFPIRHASGRQGCVRKARPSNR